MLSLFSLSIMIYWSYKGYHMESDTGTAFSIAVLDLYILYGIDKLFFN